jgi:phage-related protein
VAKRLYWVGRSREDLREFPDAARREAGHQLHLVQLGIEPADYRPMPSVGTGVMEIRIHGETEQRVFYVAKFSDAVFVLHAFEKKTRKTATRDIELGKQRLKEARRWLRDRKQ